MNRALRCLLSTLGSTRRRTAAPSARRGVGAVGACLVGFWMTACTTVPTPLLIALPPAPITAPAVPLTLGPATSAAAGAAVPVQPAPPQVLLVRRLTIPEYMAARRVRYWADAATLAEWPDTYWAERIEVGMAREFVAALRARLPGWTVCDASCGDTVPHVTLKVDLLRLDLRRREQQLVAQAELRTSVAKTTTQPTSDGVRSMPSWQLPVVSDTVQGQAQAMSDLLQQLASAAVALVLQANAGPGATR